MDKDELKTLVKNVDTELFEIVNNLICSICQELFNKPVTTPCGHSFCNGCIKRFLSAKDNSGCPLCKNAVKRYCLKPDEVKTTLTRICQQLPSAFESDVRELASNFPDSGEDLIKASKLSHLLNQDSKVTVKERPKRKSNKRTESKAFENDSSSFIPVVKKSKNVLEYASAKKKKMEDLVSISQTEPASNSSFSNSPEVVRKLQKIEKIPPEKKVNEWFNAVGDNIFINSPGSIIESSLKVELENNKKEAKSSMIRRDYNKTKPEPEASTPVDLYEFVPSQNNNVVKKKPGRKPTKKKIPDFQAIQSFTKESLKRSTILLTDNKEEERGEEEMKATPKKGQITASQKFEQLLSETKKEEKKCHVLFSASQSSSTQFLDVSFHSKVEAPTPGRTKKPQNEESYLFKNIEPTTGRRRRQSKRQRSSETPRSEKKKKLSADAMQLEKFLIKKPETTQSTKLGMLLKELLDDDLIYATRPKNAPIRLPELRVADSCVPKVHPDLATQNTELIGFCTQEEPAEESAFKKMVENMEKELKSTEDSLKEMELKYSRPKTQTEKDLNISEDEEPNVKDVETVADVVQEKETETQEFIENITETSEIPTKPIVEFLHLGKLTPIPKRSKTTVVKLVFPIGLTSLARRRAFESTSSTPRNSPQQISTGIQTTPSKVPSTDILTTETFNPSVEIQTTQKISISTEMQTSQRMVSQQIQTTQVCGEAVEVQTTQLRGNAVEVQTTQTVPSKPKTQYAETPVRKRSVSPRKIIENKILSENDLIMDFGSEENSEKHENLVEIKNKKNKEKTRRSSESDDSDVQPIAKRKSIGIFSSLESESGIVKEFETRQYIPLDVRKPSEEDMEVIDLGSNRSQNSQEQMNRVLQNIEMDLPKEKHDRGEESDSDFFVEQTPPKSEMRSSSRTRQFNNSLSLIESKKAENSEGVDLIGDVLPKGFSESFLLSSVPSKEAPKGLDIGTLTPMDSPNENDQNRLNSSKPKENPLSAVGSSQRKIKVVASSVKNDETIRKFVNKFKIEYLNKPTKDMTHLIVGLHENDDKELLPLCTPKLLFAMANKKWIVSELWVESCLEMGFILPEDTFETMDPIGGFGCKMARISKEKLLKNCEVHLLGDFEMISKEDLAALITDCGGALVSTPEKFSFSPSKIRMIIMDPDCLKLSERQLKDLYEKHSTVIIDRDYLIMSIQSYNLVNMTPYLLHPATEENLIKLGYPPPLVRIEEDELDDTDRTTR